MLKWELCYNSNHDICKYQDIRTELEPTIDSFLTKKWFPYQRNLGCSSYFYTLPSYSSSQGQEITHKTIVGTAILNLFQYYNTVLTHC